VTKEDEVSHRESPKDKAERIMEAGTCGKVRKEAKSKKGIGVWI
jgi:hypothetical protein